MPAISHCPIASPSTTLRTGSAERSAPAVAIDSARDDNEGAAILTGAILPDGGFEDIDAAVAVDEVDQAAVVDRDVV